MQITFIIGTGRCGSTLIHEILAKHEDIGFVSNIEDNILWLNRLGVMNNYLYRSFLGNYTKKGGARFAPSEAYKLISKEVSPIYANSCRDLTAKDVSPWLNKQFRHFFERRFRAQGKPIFLHKYTGWSRIGFFSTIFPEARFVHIVRDGRAVANSWLQMPWWGGYRGPENWQWGMLPPDMYEEWLKADRSFVTLAAINWKILIDSFQRSECILGKDRYMLMRFEDVLKHPRDSFNEILKFIGVCWSKEFEKNFSKQVFYPERMHAFLRDLSPLQIKEIESSLHQYLAHYGY